MSAENEPIEEALKQSSEETDEHDPIEIEDDDEKTAKVDSELEEAETDEDREEIRARRRQERKSRGQRNRERVEALERNLQALMEQNQALQQQVGTIQNANTGSQLAQVDQAITQAVQAAEHFKSVIAQAAAKGDGKTLADATEYMIAARTKAQQLTDFKESAVRNMNAPKPLDKRLVDHSTQFLGRNSWYGGPTSADPDSKVLTALDNSLTAEGWDPTSKSYWDELEKRKEKYLPHRASKSAGRSVAQRSPVSGGSTQSVGGVRRSRFLKNVSQLSKLLACGKIQPNAQR